MPPRYLTTLSIYDRSCEPIIGALPAGEERPIILGGWSGSSSKVCQQLRDGLSSADRSNGKVGHLRPSETYPPDAERRFGCASASRGDLQVEVGLVTSRDIDG